MELGESHRPALGRLRRVVTRRYSALVSVLLRSFLEEQGYEDALQ